MQTCPGQLLTKSNTAALRSTNLTSTGSTFNNGNLGRAAFNDVNLAEATVQNANLFKLRISNANLSSVSIADSNTEGMTIDAIPVADLIAAYKAARSKRN